MKTLKHFGKRGLASLLVLVMCLSLLPMTVFAADVDEDFIPELADELVEPGDTAEADDPKDDAPEAEEPGGAPEADDPADEAGDEEEEPVYATLDDFMDACDAMGDADDEEAILAVLDNIEAVYANLSDEDKEAVADMWAYVQDYAESVRAGQPDDGIQTLATDTITIKVRYCTSDAMSSGDITTITIPRKKQNNKYIQVDYTIPQLNTLTSYDYGRVTKVVGNWYFPSGNSSEGANIQWSSNATSVTMTYWVTKWEAPHTCSYSWVQTKAPTCTAKGTETYKCSCGATDGTRDVAALGHAWPSTWTDSCANHVTEGCTQHKQVCTRCNGTLSGGTKTAAHTYPSSWTVVTAATTDAKGLEKKVCTASGCGHTIYQDIAKLPGATKTVTVTWLDPDGNHIKQETIPEGEDYTDKYPGKPTDTGKWGDPVVDPETGNITIQWEEPQETENPYAVRWMEYDPDAGWKQVYKRDNVTEDTEPTWEYVKAHNQLNDPADYTEGGKTYTYTGWDAGTWNDDHTVKTYKATYQAKQAAEKVTLTYNSVGGSTAPAAQTQDKGSEFTVKGQESMTKNGYSFAGWATVKGSLQIAYKAGDKITLDQDTTIYAVWVDHPYGIKYNVLGKDKDGTVDMTSMPKDYAVRLAEPTHETTVSTQIPTRDGYTFAYWMLGPGGKQYNPGDTITFSADPLAPSGETHWLYAHWQATLTYDANGGSNAPAAETKVKGNSDTSVPFTVKGKESMTKDGYEFLGWSTDKDATSADYKAGGTINTTGHTTLYAVWAKNPNPKLKSITKELVGEAPASVEVGDTVKLTYKITVTGDKGAKYTVRDPEANPAVVSGTIGESGQAEITVTKTVTATEAGTLTVTNTAYVKPGEDTDPIDPNDPEPGHPSEKVETNIPVEDGDDDDEPKGKVNVTVVFVNENGEVVKTVTVPMDKDADYDMTEETEKIPDGYVRDDDQDITGDPVKGTADSDKTITVPVKKADGSEDNTEKVTVTILFKDEDGDVVKTVTVEKDKDKDYDVTDETKEIPNGYVANGDPEGPVTGTANGPKTIIVPVKKPGGEEPGDDDDDKTEKVTVTVKFVDEDGNVVGKPVEVEVDKDKDYDVTEEAKKVPEGYEVDDEAKPDSDPVKGTADSDKTIIVPVKKTGTTTPVNPGPGPNPGPNPGPTPTPTPTPGPGIILDPLVPMGGQPDDGEEIMDDDVPLASAIGLNDTDHMAYIIGYDDGLVHPEGYITRAEVTTIFFRLMTDTYRAINWSTVNDFSDVAAGKWYNNAVSTCANAEIVTGYTDGTFAPNQYITRAEFAAIVSRLLDGEYTGESVELPADCTGHWAADAIRSVIEAGWFEDSDSFRPNDNISRAEAITVINRMLHRLPDKEHLLPEMKTWEDNPETKWYYEAVQEATNEHDYEWIEENVEDWTELLTIRDWAALEEEWAEAYSA